MVEDLSGQQRPTLLEEILEERDALKKELDGLRKYVKLSDTRHKKEMRCLANELGEVRSELKETASSLEAAKDALCEERSTSGFLRQDLTRARGEIATWRHKVEALEGHLQESRHFADDGARADRACDALAREMGRCARDLHSLALAAGQLARGEQPAVDGLLGITDPACLVEEAAAAADELSPGQRLARAKTLLEEVKSTREDIARMREQLSEKYAENLGNDFNSCVTQ